MAAANSAFPSSFTRSISCIASYWPFLFSCTQFISACAVLRGCILRSNCEVWRACLCSSHKYPPYKGMFLIFRAYLISCIQVYRSPSCIRFIGTCYRWRHTSFSKRNVFHMDSSYFSITCKSGINAVTLFLHAHAS